MRHPQSCNGSNIHICVIRNRANPNRDSNYLENQVSSYMLQLSAKTWPKHTKKKQILVNMYYCQRNILHKQEKLRLGYSLHKREIEVSPCDQVPSSNLYSEESDNLHAHPKIHSSLLQVVASPNTDVTAHKVLLSSAILQTF